MFGGVQVRFDRKAAMSLAVAAPLAALLLWLTLRNMDLGEVWAKLRSARPGWFAFAVAAQALALALRAARWRVLLNAEGSLKFGTVFSALSAGYLGNNVLPARMGELIRTAAVAWAGSLSLGYVLATALTERLVDAAALVGVASTALAVSADIPDWLDRAARTLAVASAVGIGVIAVLPHLERRLGRILGALPFGPRLRTLAGHFLLGLRALHQAGRAVQFLALTAAIWPLDGLMAVSIGESLGARLGFGRAMILIAAMGLSSAVPSTPGYVGVYQFAAVTVLAPLRVDREDALAVVLLVQAVIYLVMIAAGLAGLAALRRMRPQAGPEASR